MDVRRLLTATSQSNQPTDAGYVDDTTSLTIRVLLLSEKLGASEFRT